MLALWKEFETNLGAFSKDNTFFSGLEAFSYFSSKNIVNFSFSWS